MSIKLVFKKNFYIRITEKTYMISAQKNNYVIIFTTLY